MRLSTRFVLFIFCMLAVLCTRTITFAAQNELVSVATDGTLSNGDSGKNGLAISSDGRFIAFASDATNLVPGGTQSTQVYVRDCDTNNTEIVSVASDGTIANDASSYPAISGDGRYVAFMSKATNLIPGGTPSQQVYLHDRQTGQTELVSVAADGTCGNKDSSYPVISADGQIIAFVSYASNLTAEGSSSSQLFARDRETGQTSLLSNHVYDYPIHAISRDGRYVVFANPGSSVQKYDRLTGQTSDVARYQNTDHFPVFYFGRLCMNGDATAIVIQQTMCCYDQVFDLLYVSSGGTQSEIDISSGGAKGNDISYHPSMSDDGRFVIFQTDSTNLVSNLNISDYSAWDTRHSILLRDTDMGTTWGISIGFDGYRANGVMYDPCISADGHYMTYATDSSNMVLDSVDGINVYRRCIVPDIAGVSIFMTTPWYEPIGIQLDQSLDISGTASAYAGLKNVSWSTDRGESGDCTGTTNWSATGIVLHKGRNVITVTAEDTSGIKQTAQHTVIYGDTTPPTLTITSPTANGGSYSTASSSVLISGTASDDYNVTVSWQNDRDSRYWRNRCNGSTSWSSTVNLQPGVNNITVYAVDACGNSTSSTLTVTYNDNIPPTVKLTYPLVTGGSYSALYSTIYIEAATSDNNGVTDVSWTNDRGGEDSLMAWSSHYGPNNSWHGYVYLKLGVNVITVTATDVAGNKASTKLTVTLADTTPPRVNIASPTTTGSYATTSQSLAISGTASDNVGLAGSITWSNSQGGSGTCTGTTSWRASGIKLLLGVNVITVTATDAAGNKASSTLTVTYPDTAPPTVNITSPTSTGLYTTNTQSLTIRGTASDNVGVNGVSWVNDRGGNGTFAIGSTTSGINPKTIAIPTNAVSWNGKINLQPGVNVITVTATDAAVNKGTTTITVTYTDITPPTIKITVPTTAATYTTTTQSLILRGFTSDNVGVTAPTWSSDRGGSGTCTIDRGTWATSKIILQPGANVFTVTATDAAGNKGTATITVTYTDVTLPTIKITVPTTAATYATTTQSLILRGFTSDNVGVTAPTWSSDRGGSGTCTIDRGTWATSKIILQPGANVFTVTETDAAGNKCSSTITVTYTDVTPPTIKITVPTNAATYATTTSSVILKGFTSDNIGVTAPTWSSDRGGCGTCTIDRGTWATSKITLQPGVNVLTVTETDAAGNTASSTIQVVR